MSMKTLKYGITALLACSLSACIENDIPYPYIEGVIQEIQLADMQGDAVFNNQTRTIEMTVGEDVFIDSVPVTRLITNEEAQIYPDAEACVKASGFPNFSFSSSQELPANANTAIDFTKPVQFLLQTYQDYVWTVTVNQEIERAIEVEHQAGQAPLFDFQTHIVIIYVTEEADYRNIKINKLNLEGSEWVVVGQPMERAAKVPLSDKAPVAALIMLLMVVAMVFNLLPAVLCTLIASILMILTGCFRNVEAAYKTINWESIVLIAAMLPMSLALEKTGASQFISNSLVSGLGQFGPIALMAGIYFTTSLMTMFISNTATAVLLAPIALQSAEQIGVSPVPFLFAVTVAASMCFASPFSTPPNALVMPAGQYTFMDYVKVGLPLQIIMGVVMVFALPLLFPF